MRLQLAADPTVIMDSIEEVGAGKRLRPRRFLPLPS